MKIIFSLLLVVPLSLICNATSLEYIESDNNLYFQNLPDSLHNRIIEIGNYGDSLSGKKYKNYLFKLDSIATFNSDSGNINLAVFAWEKLYQWNDSMGNVRGRTNILGNIYSAWLSNKLAPEIEKEWAKKLFAMLELERNYEKAYQLSTIISERNSNELKQTISNQDGEIYLLNSSLNQYLNKARSDELNIAKLNAYLLIGAIAAGTLLILLIVILIVQKSKFKKKLSQSEIPVANNQDTEILQTKLKDVEREKEQLKKVASIGIDKLNELDSTINNALGLLADTTEELEVTIQESTNLTESSRNELPVALYMSQKNLLHRIGNQVVQDLKNCSEILKRGLK